VSYTRGLELLLVLIVFLFLLLAAIRVVARGMRHIRREQELDEAVRRLNGQA
jgi:type II secretory pathway pseudopilin PulG